MKTKIIASIMSTVLFVSTLAATAHAAEGSVTPSPDTSGNTYVSVRTQLNMSEYAVTAPDVTFTYTLTGAVADGEMYEDVEVKAGVDAAAQFTLSSDVSFKTTDILSQNTSATDNWFRKQNAVQFNAPTFPDAGVYRYVLSTTRSTVDGIYMEADLDRALYVFVEYDENGDKAISDVIMYKGDGIDESAKSKGFEYSYNIKDTDGKYPSYEEGDPVPGPGGKGEEFVISAIAKGSMAERTKEFTYTLEGMDLADGTILKTTDGYVKYTGDKLVPAMWDATSKVFTTGTEDVTTNLASGETFTIYAPANGSSFTATISDYTGYDTYTRDGVMVAGTSWGDDISGQESITRTVAVATTDADAEGIDFATVRGADDTVGENDSDLPDEEDDDKDIAYPDNIIPDTGVVLQMLPFLLMALFLVAVMGCRAYKFATKR